MPRKQQRFSRCSHCLAAFDGAATSLSGYKPPSSHQTRCCGLLFGAIPMRGNHLAPMTSTSVGYCTRHVMCCCMAFAPALARLPLDQKGQKCTTQCSGHRTAYRSILLLFFLIVSSYERLEEPWDPQKRNDYRHPGKCSPCSLIRFRVMSHHHPFCRSGSWFVHMILRVPSAFRVRPRRRL